MLRPLDGRAILVVEDDPLIAMDLAEVLENAGASVLTTRTLEHAAMAVERPGIACAIVDRELQDGDTTPIRSRLSERGIPFAIYSGRPGATATEGKAPQLTKPATEEQILATMVDLIMGHQVGA